MFEPDARARELKFPIGTKKVARAIAQANTENIVLCVV